MIYTIINTPLSVWTQLKLLFCLKHCQSWNARTLQTFFNLNIKTFSYLYGQIMLKLVQRFKRTGIQHVSSFSGRTNFMVWWKAILLCQRTEVQPGTGDRQTKKKKKWSTKSWLNTTLYPKMALLCKSSPNQIYATTCENQGSCSPVWSQWLNGPKDVYSDTWVWLHKVFQIWQKQFLILKINWLHTWMFLGPCTA